MDPTKRRVFAGETVPASEKVVSLFEPHTDIICKGGRATHYGHKINLKRCFGLDRCHWRGWERFQAYVHSAVFAPQPDAADSLTAILTPVSVAASARSSLTLLGRPPARGPRLRGGARHHGHAPVREAVIPFTQGVRWHGPRSLRPAQHEPDPLAAQHFVGRHALDSQSDAGVGDLDLAGRGRRYFMRDDRVTRSGSLPPPASPRRPGRSRDRSAGCWQL